MWKEFVGIDKIKVKNKKLQDVIDKTEVKTNYGKKEAILILNKETFTDGMRMIRFNVSKNGKSYNYALAYAEISSKKFGSEESEIVGREESNDETEISSETVGSEGIDIKYFCVGANYSSSDGEFRKRFNNFGLMKVFETDFFKEGFEKICELIDSKLQVGGFEFTIEISPKYAIDEKDKIYLLDLAKKFYYLYFSVVCSDIEYYYSNVIYPDFDEDILYFINKIDKYHKISGTVLLSFKHMNDNKKDDPYYKYYIDSNQSIGIKQIPLLSMNNSIIQKAWREFYFNKKIQEIVINGISIGFAPIGNVGLFKHVSSDYYNLTSLKDRVKELEDIQTLVDDSTSKISSLVLPMHLIGNTLKDLFTHLCAEDVLYRFNNLLGNDKHFHKLCFDYIYNIYNMHLLTGICHTDLHLNNVTYYVQNANSVRFSGNDYALYKVDEKRQYLLAYGCVGSIIDFSRGFIHYKRLVSDESVEIEQRYQVIRSQNKRIVNLFNATFPEIMKKCGSVFAAALSGESDELYEYVFNIIKALDYYQLFGQFHAYYKEMMGRFVPPKDYVEEKLEDDTENFISKKKKLYVKDYYPINFLNMYQVYCKRYHNIDIPAYDGEGKVKFLHEIHEKAKHYIESKLVNLSLFMDKEMIRKSNEENFDLSLFDLFDRYEVNNISDYTFENNLITRFAENKEMADIFRQKFAEIGIVETKTGGIKLDAIEIKGEFNKTEYVKKMKEMDKIISDIPVPNLNFYKYDTSNASELVLKLYKDYTLNEKGEKCKVDELSNFGHYFNNALLGDYNFKITDIFTNHNIEKYEYSNYGMTLSNKGTFHMPKYSINGLQKEISPILKEHEELLQKNILQSQENILVQNIAYKKLDVTDKYYKETKENKFNYFLAKNSLKNLYINTNTTIYLRCNTVLKCKISSIGNYSSYEYLKSIHEEEISLELENDVTKTNVGLLLFKIKFIEEITNDQYLSEAKKIASNMIYERNKMHANFIKLNTNKEIIDKIIVKEIPENFGIDNEILLELTDITPQKEENNHEKLFSDIVSNNIDTTKSVSKKFIDSVIINESDLSDDFD
jgi:hypothetical protein